MSLIKNARAVKTPCNHNYLFGAYHKSQVMRGGHSLFEWCFLKHCCVVLCYIILSAGPVCPPHLFKNCRLHILFTHCIQANCYTTTVM